MRTKPSAYYQRYSALLAQEALPAGIVHFLTRVGLPRSGKARILRAFAEAVEAAAAA